MKAVPTSSTVDLKFPDESDLRNKSFTLPLVSTGMVKLGISVPFDYPIPLSSLLPLYVFHLQKLFNLPLDLLDTILISSTLDPL